MSDGMSGQAVAPPWGDEAGLLRAGSAPLEGRRADAGTIRLTRRDVTGLLWCGEMYGARADLLAKLLGVNAAAVRTLHMRWRRAGLVETGSLGPGPLWCWLTRAGLSVCGLAYEPKQPPLARLRHVHAAGAVRLALERWDTWRAAGAWWRSERHLRWRLGAGVGRAGHVPDGEVGWPDGGGSYDGQVWCVEVELTAKTVGRTAGIMAAMLARAADYGDGGAGPGGGRPRYARVVYVAAPAARATVERAKASLPAAEAGRVEVRDVPQEALS